MIFSFFSDTESMTLSTLRTPMIYFVLENQAFVISVENLLGISAQCPVTSYPGLPSPITGIVQWAGQIFPVIFLPKVLGSTHENTVSIEILQKCTFLFIKSPQNLVHNEFETCAIAIPTHVETFIARTLKSGAATDTEGRTARIIDLHRLEITNGNEKIAA